MSRDASFMVMASVVLRHLKGIVSALEEWIKNESK